ncbi:MAG: helix-turn-helix domain-containing protein [Magnetococcales bacterium]|nr:helix-turn-helix domain-containing protein [Magnetococcales bacterium]MBF0583977.1 helix-turn-helix domain-containing protein [Magnetococcales bacterium]
MDSKWTPKMVAARMEEAATTLKRLPGTTLQGCRAFWPEILHTAGEAYGWDQALVRLGPPPADAITRMDECLEWLRWLEADQAKLVWLRAERAPWKLIVVKFACDRSTAWRKWNIAIHQIAARLDAKPKKMLQQQNARHLQQNLLQSESCLRGVRDDEHTR